MQPLEPGEDTWRTTLIVTSNSLTYYNSYKEDAIVGHGWVIDEVDDESSKTAQEGSHDPCKMSTSSIVGVVGEEGAEEAGDVLDQRDDGQVGGVDMDTVLLTVITLVTFLRSQLWCFSLTWR